MKFTITYRMTPTSKTERQIDVHSRTERAASFAFQNKYSCAVITDVSPARMTVEVEDM